MQISLIASQEDTFLYVHQLAKNQYKVQGRTEIMWDLRSYLRSYCWHFRCCDSSSHPLHNIAAYQEIKFKNKGFINWGLMSL